MVSLMVLSHSASIARGLRELALEMAGAVTIYAVGGTKAGTLGSDFDATLELLEKAASEGDVIVLADMGSTRMTFQMAFEALTSEQQNHVYPFDAALVEGAVVAAVAIGAEMPVDAVLNQLEDYKLNKS